MSQGIVFNVETSRILALIADDIYDSPFAMLRENVQNAYDAIRMRFVSDGKLQEGGKIDIAARPDFISISDNGIGMTLETLQENFWKAGSSGKHSDKAKNAGVVGTFGIGAMANFGVCTELVVETRNENSDGALRSKALRDDLKVAEECITLEKMEKGRDIGTTVSATLDAASKINLDQAKAYLKEYVRYLPVPVTFNGELISCEQFGINAESQQKFSKNIGVKEISDNSFAVTIEVFVDSNSQVLLKAANILFSGKPIDGEMLLVQSGGQLMGLRSYFGLAPVPVSSVYSFGGVANLAFLKPTAGREALQRESIEFVQKLISLVERGVSEMIAETSVADNNNAFLSWVGNARRYDLAKNVKVRILPDNIEMPLGQVRQHLAGKNCLYYQGSDKNIIETFATQSTALIHISQSNPRRNIQIHYVVSVLSFRPVPSNAQVLKTYEHDELTYAEAAILVRIGSILRDDYLAPEMSLVFADISHGVNILVDKDDGSVRILIAKSSPIILPLIECYDRAYELFTQFIKDFVRNHVYSRIQEYIPSSTRDGVESLRKILQRNRELYSYEDAERGDLEGVLGEYLTGETGFQELIKVARVKTAGQSQKVSRDQVGTVESVVPDVVDSPAPPSENLTDFSAMPPILRKEISSDKKLLTTDQQYPQLNNFTTLLGLSDRLMRTEAEFFYSPHTTRVLWAGHRVIYIFTEVTGRLSLYYDIELRNPIDHDKAGGGMFPTTTLITKTRIFVPVPHALENEFRINSGSKEFFVRFDILTSESSPDKVVE